MFFEMIFIHKYIKKLFLKKLFCILIHDPKKKNII
jgi:hypothetical protein